MVMILIKLNFYTSHKESKKLKFFCNAVIMDTEEFRKYGKEMVDFICNYLETIQDRRVTPTVSPGWLKNEIPSEAPFHPESFDDIMKDVEEKIMPGVSNFFRISLFFLEI